MEIYKVLMFGARDWYNPTPVQRELAKLIAKHGTSNLVIIEGKAPGADQMSGHFAHEANVHVCEVAALWATRRNGAGPQRNRIMRLLDPDEAICFHHKPGRLRMKKGSGSAEMKRQLDKAGIPVKVVSK